MFFWITHLLGAINLSTLNIAWFVKSNLFKHNLFTRVLGIIFLFFILVRMLFHLNIYKRTLEYYIIILFILVNSEHLKNHVLSLFMSDVNVHLLFLYSHNSVFSFFPLIETFSFSSFANSYTPVSISLQCSLSLKWGLQYTSSC